MRVAELSNEACSISYDADTPCIVIEWHGYATTPQFREVNENALWLLTEKQCSKILADTTKLPMISTEDLKWVNEVWLPRAIQAGYRACGMVNSRFYFSRVAISNAMKHVNRNEVQLEYFDSQAAARAWLKSL